MCGIAGIIEFESGYIDPALLVKMRDSLTHRGPDDAGIWIEGGTGLAHRRLSIIDLSSAGHQPFFSDDGNLIIVYNGEIYNYRELRKELEQYGYKFRTQTDTEVLLKYYQYAGKDCLEKLNGIFAFAIWDRRRNELFVARDRAGVKPFYYSSDPKGFYFASEPKAIFAKGVEPVINEAGLDELIAFRFISGENTIFSNIKKLLPGHYAIVKAGKPLQIERWWNLGERILNHPVIEKPYEWFTDIFQDSVKYRMISDAPVGVLLSAGLDSSSITKVLQIAGYSNIQTFNVGFRDKKYDESVLAEKFCSEIGFSFNKIYVEPPQLKRLIEKASFFIDEPLTHYSDSHIYAIACMAKEKVSVLLSGESADEVLGGYVRYRTFQYRHLWGIIRSCSAILNYLSDYPRFSKLRSYLRINNEGMMQMMNASETYPDELVNECNLYGINLFPEFRLRILKEARKIYPSNPLRQLLYLDQHTYLQSLNDRNDRATMGAGIECREPIMDYRIMEGIGTLDDKYLFHGKKNKHILAETIGSQLPPYIQSFRKVGFSVPWSDYLVKDEFMNYCLMNLEQSEIFKMGILGKINIPALRNDFLDKGLHKSLVIQLVFIKIWFDSYFENVRNII
jgi:asparagine synthase (glutamine-hydrolysing)